ncbi:hypothetical protein E2C01_013254 [Portunus trituberculatus]|uniref:Uncharacterized protein n=1 Tax=Portunus trituberculatus TaxID=210409 RepID=A0A5B7DGS6_PORTR|nr:hypothetical protein [Portunus trituberculatus]
MQGGDLASHSTSLKESLRIVIGVNVDLGNGIVSGRLSDALMDAGFQPCQQQFQACDDLGGRVHDCRITRDGPANRVGGISHINDDHLCRVTHLLSDTDELVRLHSEGVEPNVGCLDSNIGELKEARQGRSPTGSSIRV